MSTTGHESEAITVQGLKASLQKFKTEHVDTLMGPTYDAEERSISFPVTSRASYNSENRYVTFD